jgi:hypothetical protein
MKTMYLIVSSFLVVLFCLSGCQAPMQYKVGRETFSSKEEALARMDKVLDEIVSGISPTKTPSHGVATVVIPTIERIQKTEIKFTGNMKEKQMRESLDYVSKTQDRQHEFMYRAIEKRQLFDKVNLLRSPTPENASVGAGDYVIYFDNPNSDLAQWFVKGKDWTSPRPINANTALPLGVPRTISWLDNLEESIGRGSPK